MIKIKRLLFASFLSLCSLTGCDFNKTPVEPEPAPTPEPLPPDVTKIISHETSFEIGKTTTDTQVIMKDGKQAQYIFDVEQGKDTEGGILFLNEGGILKNKTLIPSLSKFKVIFEGNLSYKIGYTSKQFSKSTKLTSGKETKISKKPNYIIFEAGENGATIKSIEFEIGDKENPMFSLSGFGKYNSAKENLEITVTQEDGLGGPPSVDSYMIHECPLKNIDTSYPDNFYIECDLSELVVGIDDPNANTDVSIMFFGTEDVSICPKTILSFDPTSDSPAVTFLDGWGNNEQWLSNKRSRLNLINKMSTDSVKFRIESRLVEEKDGHPKHREFVLFYDDQMIQKVEDKFDNWVNPAYPDTVNHPMGNNWGDPFIYDGDDSTNYAREAFLWDDGYDIGKISFSTQSVQHIKYSNIICGELTE